MPSAARVIVAEDDGDTRAELVDFLAERGIAACGVANAADLLGALVEEKPRVVIIDVGLPDLDGVRLAEVIAGIDVRVSAIFISGDAEAVARARASSVCVLGVFPKPLDAEGLARMVHAVN